MNRHERRKAAALARRDGLTRESALAAIRAALPPEVRAELAVAKMDETLLGVADCVVGGLATIAEAAEAITYSHELAEATARGDLTREIGCELVDRLRARQRGDLAAD
jgi:hypothetical protein